MMLCLAEIRTYQLPNDEQMRYVLNHGRGFIFEDLPNNCRAITDRPSYNTRNASQLTTLKYIHSVV